MQPASERCYMCHCWSLVIGFAQVNDLTPLPPAHPKGDDTDDVPCRELKARGRSFLGSQATVVSVAVLGV